MKQIRLWLFVLFALVVCAPLASAQNNADAGAQPVQLTTPKYSLIPISATAAVNTSTTLTIPAPPPTWYNYVCYLAYQVGNDNTATVVTNVVSTSTNFNSFAVKFSAASSASTDSGVQVALPAMQPTGGCAKSTSPGVATTFVSPASVTHAMWTWYGLYYQGP